MHDANDCTIASLLFATPPILNFARIVGELDAKLGQYPHDRRSVSWDLDDIALFDVDGARLALGWADGLPGAWGACLTVAVSPGRPDNGTDRLAGRRRAVCQMIAERIARRYPPDALIWHQGNGMVTSDTIDEMVEACILLSQGTEAQAAEEGGPDEDAAEALAQAVAAKTAKAGRDAAELLAPLGDIRADVEAIDRAVAEALAARMAEPGPNAATAARPRKAARRAAAAAASRPASRPASRAAPEPKPASEPADGTATEPPLFSARPRAAQHAARTRLASEVDLAAMDRLMERMEAELAVTPDRRVRLAPRPVRPEGVAADRPAPPDWARLEPANTTPDLPPPLHDQAARIRAALYQPRQAGGEEAGDDDRPSIPMRLAVGTMSGVLLLAVAPVGGAVLTYNALHGADFKVTARAVALTGAALAFFQSGYGQALINAVV